MPLTEYGLKVQQDLKNYLMLVGTITTRYSTFEHVINEIIWTLCGTDERKGSCITAEIISIAPRFRILIALMHEVKCDKSLIDDAVTLSQCANKTSKFRNKYVHGPMDLGLVDGELVPITKHVIIENVLKDEWKFNQDEMLETASRCEKLTHEASLLRTEVQKHLASIAKSL